MEIEQVKMNSGGALRGMRMRSEALWRLLSRKGTITVTKRTGKTILCKHILARTQADFVV